MRRDTGFSSRLISVCLLFVALVAIMSVALVLQYGRLRTRSMCAQVKRDLRTLATAIESYCVDNAYYPPMTSERAMMESVDDVPPDVVYGPTFRRHTGRDASFSLTTPIVYLTHAYADPFSLPVHAPYRYYASRQPWMWMTMSFGPDDDFRQGGSLPCRDLAIYSRFFNPDIKVFGPTSELVAGSGARGAYTYDPTNGLFSAGDIWRFSQ